MPGCKLQLVIQHVEHKYLHASDYLHLAENAPKEIIVGVVGHEMIMHTYQFLLQFPD
jgi:hypothetical protein